MEPNFVKIQPFEYQFLKARVPRLVTYFGYEFSKNLKQDDLNRIIKGLKTKKKISVTEKPNGLLIWWYEDKPLIALSKTEGAIYTTQESINRFGIEYCQKQAAYVLQILRKYDFADFIQYIIKFEPHRIGRTPTERKMTYDALERLAKKIRRKKIRIRERASVYGSRFHAHISRRYNKMRITYGEQR